MKEGPLKPLYSRTAPDLRQNENPELADFVTRALREPTDLELIAFDGREYYLTAAPMASIGWTMLSGIDRELTRQPTAAMLAEYNEISTQAS